MSTSPLSLKTTRDEVKPGVQLAHRMTRMTASAVREILKVAERPDILSFAGGLPAPELFPVEAIADAYARVLASPEGPAALQYSTTEGFGPLREWIAARMAKKGLSVTADQVLITCGAQQGIDLVGKILLDPGDLVAVENPSYLAALQTFSGYEARFVSIASDDDGMRMDSLEEAIARARPKLIYLVPEFQNPKGTSLSMERRVKLVELATLHGIPVLEDDPYGELRFRGEFNQPIASLDQEGLVFYTGTFSKTLAPGMRLGWVIAPRHLVKTLAIGKQASDLHSSTINQRAAAMLLRDFDYEGHLDKIRAAYGERCNALLAALEKHMPKGTRWTNPEGGLFTWVRLPDGLDAEVLFPRALAQKVAFVPGAPFFANDAEKQTMRLNFSNRPPELLEEGMGRLGRVIREALCALARN
jgi:2-aminoadipate transaminase